MGIRPKRLIRLAMGASALAVAVTLIAATSGPHWKLVGWNNLGMHCMDDDYSVFSILPPFNTVDVQLIDPDGKLLKDLAGVTVTYEAVADPDGSINKTSAGKTNFWQYAQALFGAVFAPDAGLVGFAMPGTSNQPQAMAWDGAFNWFEGTGIPITPVDDNGRQNAYPLMRLVARDAIGTLLAQSDVVLPVSSEMDCRACHASVSGPAARPAAGWVNDPVPGRDYRLNILRLHDEHRAGSAMYSQTLAGAGYDAAGLFVTAAGGKPILCAACHASEALPGSGQAGIPPLTQAVHSVHSLVVSPANGLALDDVSNRTSCYQCHPGSDTRCLRGAMGASVAADGTLAMQCQSCHGTMSRVGSATRTGWFDEPNCQSCHTGTATSNSGQIRYTSVFDASGNERVPANTTFATNPNTPLPGHSLYRFSSGHGGLQCSACHGSTHAIYPTSHRNDNLANAALQGHIGTLAECAACHNPVPTTVTGGPHGMHPVGQAWISSHKKAAESNLANCRSCHGADYRGTVLSRMFDDRTLTANHDGATRTLTLWRGENLSCFICHKREDDGRIGGVFNNNQPPVVTNTTLATAAGTPRTATLTSSEPGSTLRIVRQPMHGTVGLIGSVATYVPEQNFTGPDVFTFAAFDGMSDSNLGVVSVTVGGPPSLTADTDGDGLDDLVEYALGLSPGFPSTTTATQPYFGVFDGEPRLALRIDRTFPPADVTVAVEVSGNLQVWQNAVVTTNTPALIEAHDPESADSAPARFIRLRVSR